MNDISPRPPSSILTILLIPSNTSPSPNPTTPSPLELFRKSRKQHLSPSPSSACVRFHALPNARKCSNFSLPPFFTRGEKSLSPQPTHLNPYFIIPSLLRPQKEPESRLFLGMENSPLRQSSKNTPKPRPRTPFPPLFAPKRRKNRPQDSPRRTGRHLLPDPPWKTPWFLAEKALTGAQWRDTQKTRRSRRASVTRSDVSGDGKPGALSGATSGQSS
jgi:hypothetical protein